MTLPRYVKQLQSWRQQPPTPVLLRLLSGYVSPQERAIEQRESLRSLAMLAKQKIVETNHA